MGACLTRPATLHITHLKPGQATLTMGELEECIGEFRPRMLESDQLFEF